MGRAARIAQYLVVPLLILGLWQASVDFGWVPRTLIAGPTTVALRFGEMLADGSLFRHIAISLERLVAGFVLGTCVFWPYGKDSMTAYSSDMCFALRHAFAGYAGAPCCFSLAGRCDTEWAR